MPCVFGRMVIGVRVLEDGSDDEFFDVHDVAENDVASIRPNDFLGSLKRRQSKKVSPAKTQPPAVRPRRGSVLRHRSERNQESITAANPAGWVPVVERASVGNPDPTGAEVLARLIYRPSSPRQAERETWEDVAQFMRDGQWIGINSYMTKGHPELYDYAPVSDRWYVDAEGYVRVWKRLDARSRRDHLTASMLPANPDTTAQVLAMVGKRLEQIPPPADLAQRRAMENVYALLKRELVEPVSRADRRAQLEAAVRDNPDKSLRELARQEGSSRSTIQRIRKRLDEGVPL